MEFRSSTPLVRKEKVRKENPPINRISYLDGLRGLAILLVVFYHAFCRWPDLLPYGDQYESILFLKYGYLGVQLFFLLSGFVILMSLERCKNAYDFLQRRWLRLFPAMLICSLIVFLSAGIFFERPNGQPQLQNLIPGLSFVDPYIWKIITGREIGSLEGSFWSLYVEFQFYIFAAIIYFIAGSRVLIMATLFCFTVSAIFLNLDILLDNVTISTASSFTNYVMQFGYFGWFAAGSALYMYTKAFDKQWLKCGVAIALFSSVAGVDLFTEEFLATIFISAFFILSIVSTHLQRFLSSKILLIFGFISYPLYLVHENMMISMVIKLNALLPGLYGFVLPFIAVSVIASLAFCIAKYLEKPVHNNLKYLVGKIESLSPAFSSKRGSKETSKT